MMPFDSRYWAFLGQEESFFCVIQIRTSSSFMKAGCFMYADNMSKHDFSSVKTWLLSSGEAADA